MRLGIPVRRLSWGCHTEPEPGRIDCESKEDPAIATSCDIDGLGLEDDGREYIYGIDALPELRYPDLHSALVELRRALDSGAVLLTRDFVAELLGGAEFGGIRRSAHKQTAGPLVEIVLLDNRSEEGFFVGTCK
jgi:hypothetical protein